MDTIEGLIEEWERKFGPDARRQRLIEAIRTAANASPNHPRVAELLDVTLREADPEALSIIWHEWKQAGRPDLRLRVEQELEKRRRRNRWR